MSTVTPRYSLASELVKPCTLPILTRKICFQHLVLCSGLVTLARTCISHYAAPQAKMLHRSVLVGFGTHHKFGKELTTSTEVPLFLAPGYYLASSGVAACFLCRHLLKSPPALLRVSVRCAHQPLSQGIC